MVYKQPHPQFNFFCEFLLLFCESSMHVKNINVMFKKNKFIYLFIFGCVGSLLLRVGFL